MTKILIANWKMNLDLNKSIKLAENYTKQIKKVEFDVVICPSEVALEKVGQTIKQTKIKLGAQNVSSEGDGARTGEVSALTLSKLGCKYVIIGHSERRQFLNETDDMINQKVKAVLKNKKLIPIVCIGETLAEKRDKKSKIVLSRQIKKAFSGIKLSAGQKTIVAYEPIWAIGTGRIITPLQADEQHYYIKSLLIRLFGNNKTNKCCKVIYGGSVKPENSEELLALKYVDGFLIGGASLDAKKFANIK